MIARAGYDPVWKDFDQAFLSRDKSAIIQERHVFVGRVERPMIKGPGNENRRQRFTRYFNYTVAKAKPAFYRNEKKGCHFKTPTPYPMVRACMFYRSLPRVPLHPAYNNVLVTYIGNRAEPVENGRYTRRRVQFAPLRQH